MPLTSNSLESVFQTHLLGHFLFFLYFARIASSSENFSGFAAFFACVGKRYIGVYANRKHLFFTSKKMSFKPIVIYHFFTIMGVLAF